MRLYQDNSKYTENEGRVYSEFNTLITPFINEKLREGIDIRDLELCLISTLSMKFTEVRLMAQAKASKAARLEREAKFNEKRQAENPVLQQ